MSCCAVRRGILEELSDLWGCLIVLLLAKSFSGLLVLHTMAFFSSDDSFWLFSVLDLFWLWAVII